MGLLADIKEIYRLVAYRVEVMKDVGLLPTFGKPSIELFEQRFKRLKKLDPFPITIPITEVTEKGLQNLGMEAKKVTGTSNVPVVKVNLAQLTTGELELEATQTKKAETIRTGLQKRGQPNSVMAPEGQKWESFVEKQKEANAAIDVKDATLSL